MNKIYVGALALSIFCSGSLIAQKNDKTIELLDANLTYFEKWNGIPCEF